MIDAIKVSNTVNNSVKIIDKKSNKNKVKRRKSARNKPKYAGKGTKILNVMISLLDSVDLLEKCKFKAEDFTRKRVFTFKNLVLIITNLAKKSLKMELRSFANVAKIKEGSKQAFSQARKKLNPMVFKIMNNELVKEFYKDNEFKTIHGFRLIAIDGSCVRLPLSEELDDVYGKSYGSGTRQPAMAKISMMYDVKNKLTIHGSIAPYITSERELALEHIDYLLEINKETKFDNNGIKDLIVFDRGYPSIYLLKKIYNNNIDCLFRCKDKSFRAVTEALMNGKTDQIVDIKISDSAKETIKKMRENIPGLDINETFKVRVLTFILDSGEKEVLLTSLLDKEKYPAEEIFDFYNERWDIEGNYKFQKSIAEMENFSGKSKIAIEQDFLSTVFVCNLSLILMQEAQDESNEERSEKTLKYDYKINKSIALGLMKNDLIKVLLLKKDPNKFCKKIRTEMKKNLIPVRPGRKFPRRMYMYVSTKWPTNMRAST